MVRRVALVWVVVLAAMVGVGCSATAPVMKYSTVEMDIKGKTFTMEIADDEPTREFGLMKRTYLAPDKGMVFIYDKPDFYNFWMKNCFIDLDIIWLTPGGKVVTIATLKAGDEVGAVNDMPAQYILELNSGMAGKVGLKVGDVVGVPAAIVPGTGATGK